MTDSTPLLQPDRGQAARTIHIVDPKRFDAWMNQQPPRHRAAATAQKLSATGYSHAILPGDEPDSWSVVTVVADADALSPWCLAKLAETLPEGTYRVEGRDPATAMFGWVAAQYRFSRYRSDDKPAGGRILLSGDPKRIADVLTEVAATERVRDLVNTPASDLGPAELEAAVRSLAEQHGATVSTARGAELRQGYPMIATVGQAAADGREPRLIELSWGRADAPRLAIVGKGVAFDTGGLDLKNSAAMRLMKKDMGGAAHALALAQLVMTARLPVRLHLLIPAVENAIGARAFRPGDVLNSRKGLTVENTNTDAEGRLILGDALARACEEKPELLLDFATLTGAARVALGPDLPALFANDDALAQALVAHGHTAGDPVWQLPLWDGYDEMLKSDIADLVNAAEGGFAGSITAALFLRRFVDKDVPWAHLDTFAWRASARPGRPKGGDACGLRAAWGLLKDRYPPN